MPRSKLAVTDEMRAVGAVLREAREATTMDREEAGRVCGASRSTMHGWETGLRQPAIGVICRIADAYRIDRVHLLQRISEKILK